MANVTTIDISVEDPGEYAFDRLYDKLKDLGSGGVTSSNITGIVLSLMQFVQTIGGLNGAQKKQLVISVIRKFINEEIHHILKSGHPSPLSANRGHWFGNGHFRKTNQLLISLNKEPIDWRIE